MYPDGYQKLKGALSDRYYEVKHLLAQELSVAEIADEMGVARSKVYEFVKRHNYLEFVQPGKKKDAWRKRCNLRSANPSKFITESDLMKTIDVYTSIVYDEMREQGFYVQYEDVVGVIHMAIVKSLNSYNDGMSTKFTTYVQSAIRNETSNYKRSLAQEIKKMGYDNIGVDATANQDKNKDGTTKNNIGIAI